MRTAVGYAGGTADSPTYRRIGDHAETVRVEYDPNAVTYEELLEVFWSSHDPTRRSWSRQYMSAILTSDDRQRAAAESTRDAVAERTGRRVWTEIAPAGPFFPAEDYHQKYMLRQDPGLWKEFRAIYPDFAKLVASTAAARVNGYLSGCGSADVVMNELSSYGLSASGSARILELVGPPTSHVPSREEG